MKYTRFLFFLGLITAANHVNDACFSGATCTPNCCPNISNYITDTVAPIPICTTSALLTGTSYAAGTIMSCTCSTSSQSVATFSGGGSLTTPAGNTLTLTCNNNAWQNTASQGTNALLSITC